MEFRKIIGFGNSSHVTCLPKQWLEKNDLKKGDVVIQEVNDNFLITKPAIVSKKDVECVIEFHENIDILKKRLLTAYINNTDVMIIKNPIPEIKILMKNFIAMEIVSETNNRLVARSYLDLEKVDYHKLVRKVDHIITEMFLETNVEELKELKKEVDRVCFLIFRVIKTLHNIELVKYWNCTHFLQEISNILKTTKQQEEQIIYKKAMKSFYDNDPELVCKVNQELKEIENKELAYLIKSLNIS